MKTLLDYQMEEEAQRGLLDTFRPFDISRWCRYVWGHRGCQIQLSQALHRCDREVRHWMAGARRMPPELADELARLAAAHWHRGVTFEDSTFFNNASDTPSPRQRLILLARRTYDLDIDRRVREAIARVDHDLAKQNYASRRS